MKKLQEETTVEENVEEHIETKSAKATVNYSILLRSVEDVSHIIPVKGNVKGAPITFS